MTSQPVHRHQKINPYLKVPATFGGGKVAKRVLVAELNKVTPGEPLPASRLTKMRVAARRNAQLEEGPKPTPAAQQGNNSNDTEGSADNIDRREEADAQHLRIGSDFAMAFERKNARWWELGRVERIPINPEPASLFVCFIYYSTDNNKNDNFSFF